MTPEAFGVQPLTPTVSREITRWLKAWGAGDGAALDLLVPVVYEELRRMARQYMRKERSSITLQTTALVNEAYLRLVQVRNVGWQDRAHFFAICSQLMRRILVDAARARASAKRGGQGGRVTALNLDQIPDVSSSRDHELMALDEALNELAKMDPADPLAYAGLALGYERTLHGPDPPEGALSRARAAADTALRLDDTLAEVHTALGVMQSFRDWQWEKAFRSFERALEINPNMALAYFFRAYIHCFFGRIEEAIAEIRRAQEVDPLTLEYAYGADFYRMLGRYEEAIAVGQKAVDLNPKAPFGHLALGWTYSDQGKHQESLAEYQKAADAAPRFKWYAALGYSKAGRREEVQKLLAELKQEKVDSWTAYWLVALNAMVGNKDEAFRWLDYEPHHDWIPYCRAGDEFKNLHGDPRFAAALKRMNLPPI